MLGNCAIGSRTSAAIPIITMRIAMTMATTGRSMKNFAIVRSPLLCPKHYKSGYLKLDSRWQESSYALSSRSRNSRSASVVIASGATML